VTDPNGAVVPGAAVTLKNAGTNALSTPPQTRRSYDFPLLQPGNYTLTVNASGFSAVSREGITIPGRRQIDAGRADANRRRHRHGYIVSGTSLETGSVSTGAVIERKQIAELPCRKAPRTNWLLWRRELYIPAIRSSAPRSLTAILAAFPLKWSTSAKSDHADGSPIMRLTLPWLFTAG